MNYFTIFKDVLLRPSEFFKKGFHENNFSHSLVFSIIFLLITAVIGNFFDTIYIGEYVTIPGSVFIKGLFQLLFISTLFTIGTITSFKLLGGKESYRDTFMIIAYSNAICL
jgi:hypothetical protein